MSALPSPPLLVPVAEPVPRDLLDRVRLILDEIDDDLDEEILDADTHAEIEAICSLVGVPREHRH